MDASGNFIWAKQISGPDTDRGSELTIDASGNCYVAGFFSGLTDFDPGIQVFNLTSAGLYDVFILKLDSSGNFLWAKNMGGTGYDEVCAQTINVLVPKHTFRRYGFPSFFWKLIKTMVSNFFLLLKKLTKIFYNTRNCNHTNILIP